MKPIIDSERFRETLRRAFTLVEMLVAMAITLLLMAALARSFGQIGQSVRTSRAQVDLSGRARDLTFRLREELKRCTVQPNAASGNPGDGYFVYYEGPGGPAMGALMGQSPSDETEGKLLDSRFGDYDDYLAFTAISEPDNPFRGKVPRYLLDMKTVSLHPENNDGDSDYVNYLPGDFPGNPNDPVVITSRYAEIVYFASPRYQRDVDTSNAATGFQAQIHIHDPRTGDPLIEDLDGNRMPDELRLHRRVLLIRPDLNVSCDNPNLNGLRLRSFTHDGYTYMEPDTWFQDTSTGHPAIKTPNIHGLRAPQTNRAWLIGMAPIHQQCDLSVHRLQTPIGAPSNFIRASSLEDLNLPHRRFAHVSVPSSSINLAGPSNAHDFCSMPLLAMGTVHPTLVYGTSTQPLTVPPLGALPTRGRPGDVVTPIFLNGFLRPEFILGRDLTHTDLLGDGWGLERLGEDVLSTGMLGFDVKGFDPLASNLLHPGLDGRYGIANVDDDRNGTVDDAFEAGWLGSDDQLLTPNDPAYADAIIQLDPANRAGGAPASVVALQGEFVDLGFPILAGGNIRGFTGIRRDVHNSNTPNRPAFSQSSQFALMATQLSGFDPSSSFTPSYVEGLYRSGRLLTDSSNRILLIQPAFDSYTNFYERDGFLQSQANNGFGTLWWFKDGSGNQRLPLAGGAQGVDMAANGVDDVTFTLSGGVPQVTGGTGFGADSEPERETTAPFLVDLQAIKIILRMENPQVREIEQTSVVHRFGSR